MSETSRRQFWEAPSGRLHKLQRCSGGAPIDRMTSRPLTREEWDQHDDKCRCAWRWPAQVLKSRGGA